MKKSILYLIFFLVISSDVYSTHIVGGEIIYDNIGGNNYRITLKLYRDCSSAVQFDGIDTLTPALITIIEGLSGAVDTVMNIGVPVVTSIPSSINNPCIQPPGGVCVEEGVYTCTINLQPKTGGYYIIYQSCCRNNTILNLVPGGGQGATYFEKIPGPETVTQNSSPRFTKFPPKYICNSSVFPFDHSASDPDGDSLVYSFYAPFLGLSPGCHLGSVGCPTAAAPPPYPTINYSSGYSGSYPIPSNPAFSINPATGLLGGKPNLIGQFVVGVCVKEYRNNVLLSSHYRDFQFNVRPCVVSVISDFKDQDKLCQGNVITFTNQSSSNIGPLICHWDFGVNGIFSDTSHALNPTYTFQDTGKYTITLLTGSGNPCTDTCKKIFYIYPPIKASFDRPDKQCLKANLFNFNNTGTYINGATYSWDFGSAANPDSSTLKNPTGIIYNQAGLFFVKLIAKQLICIDSMIDSVRVIGRPIAKINNLPFSYCDPARVGFSNGSTSDLPMKYQWNFSNGNSSSDFEPVQILSPPGIYNATLTVITNSVCIDTSMTSIASITVFPSPIAGFSLAPPVTTIFDPEIKFTNLSASVANRWYYDFGDGSSSTDTSAVHAYTAPGTYTVMQVVGNKYNCSDTAVGKVQILTDSDSGYQILLHPTTMERMMFLCLRLLGC